MSSSFLHPFTPPRKTEFLSIVRGEGALVFDAEGNDYIDGMASLWYVNVGHGREELPTQSPRRQSNSPPITPLTPSPTLLLKNWRPRSPSCLRLSVRESSLARRVRRRSTPR